MIDVVLDVVGAYLVVGDVGPDGSVRVEFASAGDVIGSDDESAMAAVIARMLREERAEAEVRHVSRDGKMRRLRLRCRAAPSREHPGHHRLLAVCEDVTEEVMWREQWLGRLADARHDERLRLARELHDGLGQTLTSASLYARSLEARPGAAPGSTLATLRRLVESALTETRTMMWRLRPTEVEEAGLEAALQRLAETFQQRQSVRVDVDLTAVDGLSPEVEVAAYRVAQEALTNAVKHAQPAVLSVLAYRRGPTFTLVVEDDGRGFDPSARVGDRGAGIVGMRERAEALGGRLDVASRRGHGTTVRLVVPCDEGAGR